MTENRMRTDLELPGRRWMPLVWTFLAAAWLGGCAALGTKLETPRLSLAGIQLQDASFFEQEGIDYWGMVRALFVNVRSGKKKQGASTITQQVVKTFLLSPERTFKRKFQEIILARRLEHALTKEEILTLYLKQIYFGGGRYGLKEAARYYYGKEVADLQVGEAALLAGLPQSPEHMAHPLNSSLQMIKS